MFVSNNFHECTTTDITIPIIVSLPKYKYSYNDLYHKISMKE